MLSVSRSLLLVLVASVSYSASSQAQFARNQGGALFVMNNSARRNEVISFNRAADGSLQQALRHAFCEVPAAAGIDRVHARL